jgi:rRNA processing protein Gar1
MGTALNRPVEPGDVVKTSGRHVGETGRTGRIVAVLGEADHPHYAVRWEDGRESILYPGEGTTIQPGAGAFVSAD